MKHTDQVVAALAALCTREGGHKNVANEARVSADNLWQILNGTELPSGNPRGVGPRLRKKLTHKYPDWLSPEWEVNAGELASGYCRLPIMAEAAAGDGREPLPEVINYVDVLESHIRQRLNANPAQVKVLTARGGSMTGDIEDGDIMFVQPTTEFTGEGIYILTLDRLILVKRLSISAIHQRVIIESNDGRKAEELALKDVPHRLHIQGRVIGAWSLRRFP